MRRYFPSVLYVLCVLAAIWVVFTYWHIFLLLQATVINLCYLAGALIIVLAIPYVAIVYLVDWLRRRRDPYRNSPRPHAAFDPDPGPSTQLCFDREPPADPPPLTYPEPTRPEHPDVG